MILDVMMAAMIIGLPVLALYLNDIINEVLEEDKPTIVKENKSIKI